MKVRDVLKRLRRDGWELVRTRGSHRQFQHAVKGGTVTLAGGLNEDVNPKTLKSIWRPAGLEDDR